MYAIRSYYVTQRYRSRLSGPLLDRIDLHIMAPRVPHKDLASTASLVLPEPPAPTSVTSRARRTAAVTIFV